MSKDVIEYNKRLINFPSELTDTDYDNHLPDSYRQTLYETKSMVETRANSNL